MDSGESSHFTPYFSDLQDPEQCQIEVMLEDSSRVRATQQGSVNIKFISDQGIPSDLNLHRVLYVPGLNTRLFSIPEFTRDSNFTVNFGDNYSQLIFGDGQTYKIPTPHKPKQKDTTLQLNSTRTKERGSTFTSVRQQETLPTIPVENGHKLLGHRSIRSLLTGSLYNVWADYRFSLSPDNYCEPCKISASSVTDLSKRPLPLTKTPFSCIFMDIIPHPSTGGLDTTTTFPVSLLIIEQKILFKWLQDFYHFYKTIKAFHGGRALRTIGQGYIPPLDELEQQHTGTIDTLNSRTSQFPGDLTEEGLYDSINHQDTFYLPRDLIPYRNIRRSLRIPDIATTEEITTQKNI